MIASLATFATVWVWIMILLSQIAFRRRLPPDEVKALKFKVPGGVTTTVVGLIFWSLSSRSSAIIRIPAFRCTSALRGLSCCWSDGDSSAVASANWLKHSNILPGSFALPGKFLLPNSSPINVKMMSDPALRYGKVTSLSSKGIRDVERPHLPVAPFVKQNKDQLTITLWLAGKIHPSG